MSAYTVTRERHGIVVMGPLPITDMAALLPAWQRELGYDIADALVSGHLKASMVVTDQEGSKAWRAELGLEAPKNV